MIARENTSPMPDGDGASASERSETRIDAASGPSPFDPLLKHLAELQMLVGHYLRARADGISAKVRSIVLWVIVGIVGLVVVIALLVTAVVLALHGIAVGLMMLGLPEWGADLVTGAVCIAVMALVLLIATISQFRSARRKRRDDYEHFRARFRAKFGHSFDDARRD